MKEYILKGYPRAYKQYPEQELIRCKECKYFEPGAWEFCGYWHNSAEKEGFCHKAERKTDDE